MNSVFVCSTDRETPSFFAPLFNNSREFTVNFSTISWRLLSSLLVHVTLKKDIFFSDIKRIFPAALPSSIYPVKDPLSNVMNPSFKLKGPHNLTLLHDSKKTCNSLITRINHILFGSKSCFESSDSCQS